MTPSPFCSTPCVFLVVVLASPLIGGCQLNPDVSNEDSKSAPRAADTGTAGDPDSEVDTGTDSGGWVSSVVDSFTVVDRTEIGLMPFDPNRVLEYHVSMDPSLYEEMKVRGNDEIYRLASLEVRGEGVEEDYAEVGIRYKGDYSLHHCWYSGSRSYGGTCAKLSMKIKFNEYNEDGRFFGVKKINLHAMSEDSTKLRERLAYSVFNEFGVTTARTAHAKLYINDLEPLLVLAVEAIDGRYTAYNYPTAGDGNLYKEVWPTSSLSETMLLEQLRTNDDPVDTPDVSGFITFGNAVAAATEDTFPDDMAAWLDVDQLLRYMAVDRAFKNWDGITAFYWPDRPHNLYWYHDVGASEIFHIIPWDLDKTMWEYDVYMDPVEYEAARQVPDWNVLPSSCEFIPVWDGSFGVMPPGCDNLINLLAATGWENFVVLGNELLETSLQYDAMNDKITAWAEQIAPVVEADPLLRTASWEAAVEDFRQILQKAIGEFEAHLAEGYIVEE